MATLINRVMFRAASSGTGSFVVSAPITGYMTPATGGAVDATVYSYAAESDDKTEWEIGTGTYTSGTTTLTRTPLKSSNSDLAVNFTAAPRVALTGLAADFQPADSDLTSWAAITRAAGFDTFVATPSSANLAALVTGETGSGALMFGTSPTITTDITIPNTGLHLLDTNASHDLIIAPGSDLTADRTLTITTGDSARTLTISGNATVSQDYSTTGNPQFATIELGAASDTTLSRASAGEVNIEGNRIYRASGTDVALADGGTGASLSDPNADRILFWDDSAGAMTWLTPGNGLTITATTIDAGSTLGTSVSASGTSVDFTGLPASVKWVRISFVGISTSGTSNPLIQIGDSGGIETTGYLGTGCFLGNANTTGATNYTTGFGLQSGLAAAVMHGTITLALVDASANTWAASGNIGLSNSQFICLTGGSKSLSATFDRVRITTVGGSDTFDAGSFNIQYGT